MNDWHQCIYSSYCNREYCDMSCVKNAMTTILLEKSSIKLSDDVYQVCESDKEKCWNFISSHEGQVMCVHNNNPSKYADIYTFACICNMAVGHGATVSVYHLNYTKYLEDIRRSWTYGMSGALREVQAFTTSCKILIISHLDYCNFREFECQTLLNLLQDRSDSSYTTLLVLKDIQLLSGSGAFLVPLKSRLKEALIND